MLSNRSKIIVIVGPTCTGKSELAVLLAKRIGGEIVNADAMQVYRHFDIGTAKPEAATIKEVPHHLIDIADPGETFNVALFKDLADNVIKEIWSRRKTPIVVGGTGLYVRILLYGLFEAKGDALLREELKRKYNESPLALYDELKAVDPRYALRISHRDRVRIVRALEIHGATGRSMSEWENFHGFKERRYNSFIVGLRKEREELYRLINDRVEAMMRRGWVEEVRSLLMGGCSGEEKPFRGIGYREILLYIKSIISYEDMVKEIKKQTRHYAKRQFTWFLKEQGVHWYEYPEESSRINTDVIEFMG